MSFIRKIKRGGKIYYAEVENVKRGNKVVQRHIRYIGKNIDAQQNSLPIDSVQFGYIATRLMQGDLTANELIDMVEKMGHRIYIEDLAAIGIRYKFKKNSITLSLFPTERSERRNFAQNAKPNLRQRRRTQER
jgi:hypothetical protein